MVLARLLAPRDFGLLGFALVYITYVETIGDLGSGTALIFWPNRRDEAAEVTFVTSLAMGATWCVLTIAAAPWIAGFFNSPDGEAIVRALAWSFPLKFLGNTHDALAQKELRFRPRMYAELAMGLVKGGVSIGGAFAGLGAWSLVWGQLSGLAVWSLMLWLVIPWRPHFRIAGDLVKPMLAYGRGIVVVNIVAAIVHHADAAVIGRFLGAVALGIYQIAYKVPEMSIAVIVWVVSKVAFPAFAKIHGAGSELASAYLAAMRYVTVLTVPAAVGLAVVAEPLVAALFGDRWAPAAPVLRILAVYLAIRSFGSSSGDILKATGRSKLLAILGVVRAAVLVPLLVWAAQYDIITVAIALTVATAVSTIVHMAIAGRIVRVGFAEIVVATRASLLAGAALLLTGIVLRQLLAELAAIPQLVVIVTVGAIAYIAVLYFIDGSLFRDTLALFSRKTAVEAAE